MTRFFYRNSVAAFVEEDANSILGKLASENSFDLVDQQRNSWVYEIELLKRLLAHESDGEIVFEYSIPRLGKRIDVALLLHGIIFVLEFKVGADDYYRADVEQVWDYALDLKNFHEASKNAVIVPILVATDAPESSTTQDFSVYDDLVFEPVMSTMPAIRRRRTPKATRPPSLWQSPYR